MIEVNGWKCEPVPVIVLPSAALAPQVEPWACLTRLKSHQSQATSAKNIYPVFFIENMSVLSPPDIRPRRHQQFSQEFPLGQIFPNIGFHSALQMTTALHLCLNLNSQDVWSHCKHAKIFSDPIHLTSWACLALRYEVEKRLRAIYPQLDSLAMYGKLWREKGRRTHLSHNGAHLPLLPPLPPRRQ